MPRIPPRYQPTGESSDGGMGSVFICDDKVLERKVAIKFIHNLIHQRRMIDELAALLKMRSKHVVQVYDILRCNFEVLGIVQEFIDGQDLFESHQIPSSPTDLYKQIWQIASGICDIHTLGVIHRDIKPNNMKTDPEGVIKIFDFGLARDDKPQAGTIGFVGTPGFADPELYTGIVKFTKAVDTYAFGATVLYLATGTLPQELKETPPKPSIHGYFSSITLNLAEEITKLLDCCLATDPKVRPDMCNVRDALAKHLLFNRHKALVVHDGKPSYLNSINRSVGLNRTSIGQIKIIYNGLDFRITECDGEIFINNQEAKVDSILPSACVIAFGSPDRKQDRIYVTFDVSHPEIVL